MNFVEKPLFGYKQQTKRPEVVWGVLAGACSMLNVFFDLLVQS